MAAHQAGTMIIMVLNVSLLTDAVCGQTNWRIASPDEQTVVKLRLVPAGSGPALSYEVAYAGRRVLGDSPLGISRSDQTFVGGLELLETGPAKTIDETYTMVTGKRRLCRNHAREQILVFQNSASAKLELILRVYDDGVAFRYRFPEQDDGRYVVTGESTGFRLPADGKMWAHPYDRPSKYTPAYETYYVNGVAVAVVVEGFAGEIAQRRHAG